MNKFILFSFLSFLFSYLLFSFVSAKNSVISFSSFYYFFSDFNNSKKILSSFSSFDDNILYCEKNLDDLSCSDYKFLVFHHNYKVLNSFGDTFDICSSSILGYVDDCSSYVSNNYHSDNVNFSNYCLDSFTQECVYYRYDILP